MTSVLTCVEMKVYLIGTCLKEYITEYAQTQK